MKKLSKKNILIGLGAVAIAGVGFSIANGEASRVADMAGNAIGNSGFISPATDVGPATPAPAPAPKAENSSEAPQASTMPTPDSAPQSKLQGLAQPQDLSDGQPVDDGNAITNVDSNSVVPVTYDPSPSPAMPDGNPGTIHFK